MIAPAPWQLRGRAYAFALKADPEQRVDQAGAAPQLGAPGGGRSIMMFVDYETSDVGPYHELLFIPGHYRFPDGRRYSSIGRIYVSSQASVDNGRRNWGIPKELADFEVVRGNRTDAVTISLGGKAFCRLQLSHGRLGLPVSSTWLPQRQLTLAQLLDEKMFRYTPVSRGRLSLSRLQEFWADGKHFPALSAGRGTVGGYMSNFQMTFPVAKITEL